MFRRQMNSIRMFLQSTEPMDCFKLQFKVLRILGAFQDPFANKFVKFLANFAIFLNLQLWIMSVIYLLSPSVSLQDKLQGSFTANTAFLCCIKLYYMRQNSAKLFDLVKLLKCRINSINGNETKLLHEGAIYPTTVGYIILQSAIFITSCTYAFFPAGKSNYNKPLPVYAWYPLYFSDGIPYRVVYALQEISIFCAASVWVCVDTINFGLLAHHNVMLKILSQRIADVGWTASHARGRDYNINNHRLLCDHVKYHVDILNYQDETNQLYSSIVFAKISMSAIIICSFVYSLSTETLDFVTFVCQFAIFLVIVSTLFALSWMSEQISVTSDNLLNKAAQCNFQSMDRRSTRALLILMQGLTKTVYIEVGPIIKVVLNLAMFVSIIDFAYKCLALLKTIGA